MVVFKNTSGTQLQSTSAPLVAAAFSVFHKFVSWFGVACMGWFANPGPQPLPGPCSSATLWAHTSPLEPLPSAQTFDLAVGVQMHVGLSLQNNKLGPGWLLACGDVVALNEGGHQHHLP
jgi:hypothetical protein